MSRPAPTLRRSWPTAPTPPHMAAMNSPSASSWASSRTISTSTNSSSTASRTSTPPIPTPPPRSTLAHSSPAADHRLLARPAPHPPRIPPRSPPPTPLQARCRGTGNLSGLYLLMTEEERATKLAALAHLKGLGEKARSEEHTSELQSLRH